MLWLCLGKINHIVMPLHPNGYFLGLCSLRSFEISKPWDMGLELSNCSEIIWQVLQQQCYWSTCQISEWCIKFSTRSYGFKFSQNLVIRWTAEWIEALGWMMLFPWSSLYSVEEIVCSLVIDGALWSDNCKCGRKLMMMDDDHCVIDWGPASI